MLVDSHCHIDFPELADQLDSVFDLMRRNEVERALCVSVTLEDFPRVRKLAETYPNIYASVGVHPDHEDVAAVGGVGGAVLAGQAQTVGGGARGRADGLAKNGWRCGA